MTKHEMNSEKIANKINILVRMSSGKSEISTAASVDGLGREERERVSIACADDEPGGEGGGDGNMGGADLSSEEASVATLGP